MRVNSKKVECGNKGSFGRPKIKKAYDLKSRKPLTVLMPRDGIEPPTRGFSVRSKANFTIRGKPLLLRLSPYPLRVSWFFELLILLGFI